MKDVETPKTIYLIGGKPIPRLYKKRWVVLMIYFIILPISTMQWTQFTLIANIVTDYYGVSYEAVNWTFLITIVNLIVFAFPSCYMVDKFGIKNGALFAMVGTTLSAWIKVCTVPPERFWLIILAQAILSIPQMSLISLGPKLSADWFGPDEVPIANSIGIIALQTGIALGFLLPPALVKKDTVERDLYRTSLGLAIICTIALALTIILIVDKPLIPPSQASLKKNSKIRYIKSFKNLLKNVQYLLVMTVMGCNLAILCLLESLLNQIVLKYYPNGEEDAGRMGLLMMISCILGCFVCGVILLKIKIYKLCYCVSTLLMAVTLIMFLYTLNENIIFSYVGIILYGFVYGIFWNVSYEIAAEVTYPEPEAIVIGMVYSVAQALSIGFIYFYSYLFYEISDTWANSFLVIITLISFVLTLCTGYNLKRTHAGIRDSD